MGSYNELSATMTCPRCGNTSLMVINLYFGLTDQIEYKIGDVYEWVPRKMVQNGGRPIDGNMEGKAYTVCPVCEKDSFAIAEIKNDVIVGVRPDLSKKPYDPD